MRSLPNEICSCSSLTILSVRGNKLTKIPVDIGRLTQLRVLNIVNNFLSNLPVTILNLTQLSALWISDNQSQPLMPLQKEFHKESQCYYLTCYLLPQVYTSNSTPTNAASTSTAPESTYDYYSPSTCDTSQTNMHIAALENLSLAAIAQNRKRKICFASDPPQEIAPNLRLMRSPTPYPKELRMMQAKFAANKMQQQQQHMQRYAQQENNLDKQSNKLLNTMNSENMPSIPVQSVATSNDFEAAKNTHAMLPMMNNITNDIGAGNVNANSPNAPAVMSSIPNSMHLNTNVPARHLPAHMQSHLNHEYGNNAPQQLTPAANNYGDMYRPESRMQTPTLHLNMNNDLVQYDSMNANLIRRDATGLAADTTDYGKRNIEENGNGIPIDMSRQHQSYGLSYDETSSINGNEIGDSRFNNSNCQPYQNISENETNHNNIHFDVPQVNIYIHAFLSFMFSLWKKALIFVKQFFLPHSNIRHRITLRRHLQRNRNKICLFMTSIGIITSNSSCQMTTRTTRCPRKKQAKATPP